MVPTDLATQRTATTPQPPTPAAREAWASSASALLDALAPADRARLLECGRVRSFEAGAEVVRQGSAGDCLFVVEEGELAVVRCVPGDEEEVLLRALPGMVLGEVAVLDGGARAASLRATRRSRLRAIGLGAFEALVLHGGDAGFRILLAVAASIHERLQTTRRVAAARVCDTGACAAPAGRLGWSSAPPELARVLGVLPAFAMLDEAERQALVPALRVATLERGADLVLPEPAAPGVVVVLRGALSPWFDDGHGPEVTMPAVGPGGFVDYAAALGFAAAPRRWRARSPTRLLLVDAACFAPPAEASARLLYALARGMAATLRRTTGLAMHFSMAWR